MIVVDLNQVMISNLMVSIGNHTNAELDENMIRYMVLNSLRSYKQKFGSEYGELVIACDSFNVWRKQYFPYYKANRKKNKEKSELDWKNIFECLNKIRNELKEYFPYKVVDIETAEADDVIATLVMKESEKIIFKQEDILIISGDKDFIQLHKFDYVKQYDPVKKKFITHDNPKRYLEEHILKGDTIDGIPNILSPDNCFVVGERQRPLTQKKILDILQDNYLMDEHLTRNHARNKTLIDLSEIPDDLQEKIMTSFNSQEKNRTKLMNYFIANRLRNLMEHISEF